MTPRQRWQDATTLGKAETSEWQPEEPPYQILYLWRWFLELHVSRPDGRKLLTYADILAWAQLTDRKPTPFDVKVIRQLDHRYIYVIRNPTAASPQEYLDDGKGAEEAIKIALRARANRNKTEQGMVPLKPTVAVASVGNKHG